MKYELIKTDISSERTVMQNIVEIIDEVETVTGQVRKKQTATK